MSVFLSEPGQIVFYGTLFVVVLIPVTVVARSRRHAPPLKIKGARTSTILSNVVALLDLLVAVIFGYVGVTILPDWTYFLGLAFVLFGIPIYLWGLRTLGRFFSPEVVVYQGHRLMQEGPFKYVRHPLYASLSLEGIGLGLMSQSWVGLLLIVIATSIATEYRIRVEEKVLLSEFDEQYKSYSRRVKRLVPFIY